MSARASRPIVDVLLFEVDGKLGEDREALLDRVVFERSLADPTGPLATGQQPRRVSLGRGAQRRRAALDPPRASAVSESAALVAGEHQAAGDEKRFEQPGCVALAATGAAAVQTAATSAEGRSTPVCSACCKRRRCRKLTFGAERSSSQSANAPNHAGQRSSSRAWAPCTQTPTISGSR